MRTKIIIISTVFLVSFIVLKLYINNEDKHEPVVIVKKIQSSINKEEIFFKRKSWGLTYDHEIVVLSTTSNKNFEPDSIKDYIFLDPNVFYKVSQDTIYIYTSIISKKPINFISSFKIIQFELTNPEMMNLVGYDAYKSKGLKKVF